MPNLDSINRKTQDHESESVKINYYNSANPQTSAPQTNTKKTKAKVSQPVNFLGDDNQVANLDRPRHKKKFVRLFFLISALVIFLLGSLIFSNYLSAQQTSHQLSSTLSKLNLWQQLSQLIGVDSVASRDRTNILLMGMGGTGHDGPYLTDTIILISLRPSTGQVALISIPRDLEINYNNSLNYKINEVFSQGLSNGSDKPAQFAAQIIGQNIGQEIDYYAVVDFSGFVEIIDLLGGVDIDVERAFTDNQYPTLDYEYRTVSFTAGPQHMDGATALEYARSRHGNNGEGSDFARSRRQQKLLFAIKNNILNYQTLFNPYKLTKLYNIASQYIDTNISVSDAIALYDATSDLQTDQVMRITLDDSPQGLLQSGINDIGAYVLKPKNGYPVLQNFIDQIFTFNNTAQEEAAIIIQNGTTLPGLAYNFKQELDRYGLTIISYGNAATQDYQTTIVYDLAYPNKSQTRELLQQIMPEAVFTEKIPSFLQNETNDNNVVSDKDQVDFVIILGQDKGYQDQIKQIQ
ncbi:MAG: LCP family protein [Candidatus Komeilibacteria bacterium]